eukprot:scaffold11042_cov137-Isochrysis_galbana.AAC.5
MSAATRTGYGWLGGACAPAACARGAPAASRATHHARARRASADVPACQQSPAHASAAVIARPKLPGHYD